VRICPRALERQTIIVSICNVAWSVRLNPEAVCNLLYSVSCNRSCQWCVCVLSSPGWSALGEPWHNLLYNLLCYIGAHSLKVWQLKQNEQTKEVVSWAVLKKLLNMLSFIFQIFYKFWRKDCLINLFKFKESERLFPPPALRYEVTEWTARSTSGYP